MSSLLFVFVLSLVFVFCAYTHTFCIPFCDPTDPGQHSSPKGEWVLGGSNGWPMVGG